MKKQLILSLLIVFAVALFAPTVVMAFENDVKVENLDNKEKKTEKKAEKKSGECTQKAETKTSSDCASKSEAKKSDCSAKTNCGAKKADCSSKKAE